MKDKKKIILNILKSNTEKCVGTSDVIYYDKLEDVAQELFKALVKRPKVTSNLETREQKKCFWCKNKV